jgi:hypothetical protein
VRDQDDGPGTVAARDAGLHGVVDAGELVDRDAELRRIAVRQTCRFGRGEGGQRETEKEEIAERHWR